MEIYLVGGAVRDEIMGITPKDFDYVVVGETPQSMLDAGFVQVGKDFPVFLDEDGDEYALARRERTTGKGTMNFECETDNVTLEEDLLRRDLTINAIAKNTKTGEFIDPYNGIDDIKNKILRPVSEAFKEDPVRVLRLARFYSRLLSFNLADEMKVMIKEMVEDGCLETLEPQRIYAEIRKALIQPNSIYFFTLLREFGALKQILPEIDKMYCDDFIIDFANTYQLMDSCYDKKQLITIKTVILLYHMKNPLDVHDKHWFKNADVNMAAIFKDNLSKCPKYSSNEEMYDWFQSLKVDRDDRIKMHMIHDCLSILHAFTGEDNIIINQYYNAYNDSLKELRNLDFKDKPKDISMIEYKRGATLKHMNALFNHN